MLCVKVDCTSAVFAYNSWYYRSLFILVLRVGVGGLLRAQRRPGSVVISRGISMLPFQKKYGVCLYKCPTIVIINRCGNETGKVPFVFLM